MRKEPQRGARAWLVDWTPPDGKRKRRFFTSKAAADALRSQLMAQVQKPVDPLALLTAQERDAVFQLYRACQQKGITPSAPAHRITDGLLRMGVQAITLSDAIADCLASKTAANRRPGYVKDMQLVLSSFASGRGNAVLSSVSAVDIKDYVANKYTNAQSRATFLKQINTLFSFSLRQGYVPANPCDRIERVTIDHAIPKILTPAESAKLMEIVRGQFPRGLAWFALALFAGVRPEECDVLSWDSINLKSGVVTIDAAGSKVRQRRIVHVLPAAVAWLTLAQSCGSDLPIPNITRRKMQRAIRGSMGWDSWPQDILRH